MTPEEIIKAWFAIEELGGENVYTELQSYPSLMYLTPQKAYRACIRFGLGHEVFIHEKDLYTAMEKAINKYSEWVKQNESKQRWNNQY